MRVWKGKEQEGNQIGVETLFVQGRKIDTKEIVRLLKFYKCPRLYLGAGRTNTKLTDTQLARIRQVCDQYNIAIIMEVSVDEMNEILKGLNLNYIDQIITRVCNSGLRRLRGNDVIKIDDIENLVCTIEIADMTFTPLATLQDGMFDGDELLYDDDKEGDCI
jgi:hypothetical protein